jgi:hypothetical protein
VPAASDPDRRPPLPATVAGVLSLPAALMVLLFGNAALGLATARENGGAATWLVLMLTFGWVLALLIGAARLLTGRSWLGLAVSAALLVLLAVVNALQGGLGGNAGLLGITLLAGAGATVCASLPGVRTWVSRRRREKLYPGSTRPTAGRP